MNDVDITDWFSVDVESIAYFIEFCGHLGQANATLGDDYFLFMSCFTLAYYLVYPSEFKIFVSHSLGDCFFVIS